MADFNEVPVIEVHAENIHEIWASLLLAIKSSTFIAIDTELSGLGDRKQLFAKSIDDRYKAICDVAKTRSIIALGLSCFKIQNPISSSGATATAGNTTRTPRNASVNFVAQTFNIFVLCAEDYVVEPLSLRFLIDHGFDFNRQYALGIPYTRGCDRPAASKDGHRTLRRLFVELALSQVPVVLHNALVDLVFLYQNFYASLPPGLASFVTDLSQVFAGGIYDTKYVTEFKARMDASFLEYVFRKCQRSNCCQASYQQPHALLSFLNYSEQMRVHIATLSCGLQDQPCTNDVGKTKLCLHFAGHGWCAAGFKCPNSHDVDMILDAEDWSVASKNRKRARKKKGRAKENREPDGGGGEKDERMDVAEDESSASCDENHRQTSPNDDKATGDVTTSVESKSNDVEPDDVESNDTESNDSTGVADINKIFLGTTPTPSKAVPANRSGGHRAGFDAFMTGYIFATFAAKYRKPCGGGDSATETGTLGDFGIADELANKVYLGGKDFPLQIAASNFARPSKAHVEKWERLQRE